MKTARTSPRARKHAQRHFRAVPCAQALCWRPMAVPRRPHQPRAPRTTRGSRISTHAATRAPQHTSPALPRLFAPCAGSAHCSWHLTSGCTRTRREYDADSAPRKARTHARTRTRAHARSSAQSAAQPDSLPAHTSYSTMCTHCAQRCSPHPATTACPSPHHDVSRTLRQQPNQRHCSARLCTPAVSLTFPILPAAAPPRAHTAAVNM